MLTEDQLKSIIPSIKQSHLDTYTPLLNTYFPIYSITTAQRIGAFISQVAEESANFNAVLEYASGAAYEGRTDLGNTEVGDGIKFKGRGLVQITGRAMYNQCSQALFNDDRLIVNPALLETPENATASACWFWDKVKSLNVIADEPEDWIKPGIHHYNKITWISRLVNGGVNGLAERIANYNRARQVLGF